MDVIATFGLSWLIFYLVPSSATPALLGEDSCSKVGDIEMAFKKSGCKPLGDKSITENSCKEVEKLLHCVVDNIYSDKGREHREACVMRMRNAIRDIHVDSMFPVGPFNWGYCEKEWCEDGHYYTYNQFKCIFWCLGGPMAVGIGGVLALIAAVYVALPLLGFTSAGIVAKSIAASLMAWYGGAVPAGGFFASLQSIAVLGISYKTILITFFSAATIAKAATDCGCCSKG